MSVSLTPAEMGIPNYEGTYLDFLGFRVVKFEPGFVRMQMPLERIHTNTLNMAHGGILMSMLDISSAFASHAGLPEPMVSLTMTQSTSFMRSVTGSELFAEGRVIRRTRNLTFTESKILDPTLSDNEAEQICATAQCTFKLRPRDVASS
ncbi:MAG: PaaI family thioesterase [Woeseiaceae bacterium]